MFKFVLDFLLFFLVVFAGESMRNSAIITSYRICQEAVDRFFQAEEVRTKHPDSLICYHRFPDGNSYTKTTIFG